MYPVMVPQTTSPYQASAVVLCFTVCIFALMGPPIPIFWKIKVRLGGTMKLENELFCLFVWIRSVHKRLHSPKNTLLLSQPFGSNIKFFKFYQLLRQLRIFCKGLESESWSLSTQLMPCILNSVHDCGLLTIISIYIVQVREICLDFGNSGNTDGLWPYLLGCCYQKSQLLNFVLKIGI